jgi:hypothetical protein
MHQNEPTNKLISFLYPKMYNTGTFKVFPSFPRMQNFVIQKIPQFAYNVHVTLLHRLSHTTKISGGWGRGEERATYSSTDPEKHVGD